MWGFTVWNSNNYRIVCIDKPTNTRIIISTLEITQINLFIVVILNGVDDNLRGYDLAGELDICLGSTNDSAFLILIIILLFARNVNRTDDITVAIVDIEKLRTSYEVRRKTIFGLD